MYVESLQRVLKIESLAICRRVATYKVKLRSVAVYTLLFAFRVVVAYYYFDDDFAAATGEGQFGGLNSRILL